MIVHSKVLVLDGWKDWHGGHSDVTWQAGVISRWNWNRFLFSSIRFPNLVKLSWGVPHAYQNQPWSTKPVNSILINEFMPLLSHITALDWDILTPYFNKVFSWTDLSSLQRLYILLDVISEVVPWLEALTVDQWCANCFFLDCKLSTSNRALQTSVN